MDLRINTQNFVVISEDGSEHARVSIAQGGGLVRPSLGGMSHGGSISRCNLACVLKQFAQRSTVTFSGAARIKWQHDASKCIGPVGNCFFNTETVSGRRDDLGPAIRHSNKRDVRSLQMRQQ